MYIYMYYICVDTQRSSRLVPQRLAGLQVRVVAADAGVHGVVAQEVGGSAGPLTRAQSAALHPEHAVVQQLVQDG